MTIYLAADHRGFSLKESIKSYLQEKDYHVVDCGNDSLDPEDDYPDFVFPAVEKASETTENRAIVICGSGVGVCIAANKVRGARCALIRSSEEVVDACGHDHINVLSLSADRTNKEDALEIVRLFLTSPYDTSKRHLRRVGKITGYEKRL